VFIEILGDAMSLFGALVRTAVNVVTLPVKIPIALAKDAGDILACDRPRNNTGKVLRELKDEAEA
jgi:hypothetical protein